jgi:Flp pilus assembly protein TadD
MNQTFAPLRIVMLAAVLAVTVGCAANPARQSDSPFDGKQYEELVASGDEAAQRGDFQTALVMYGEAQERRETADVWLRIGAAQRELGRNDGAAYAFRQVTELDPENAGAHEALGLLLLGFRDEAGARAMFLRAIELDANRWQAHNGLGVLADLAQEPGTAIEHFKTALAIRPGSPMLLNNVGYSLYLAGDLELAEQYFRRAVSHVDYEPAILNLGLVHARKREYRRAVETLARVVERPTAYNDVGFVAISNGDYSQAEELLREAIRLSPVHYETAQRNLALARAGSGGQ